MNERAKDLFLYLITNPIYRASASVLRIKLYPQASIFHQFLGKAMELRIGKGGDLLFYGARKIFFFGFS